MSTTTQWQLRPDAAERYAQVVVPTILGPFARALVGSAQLHPGETVVDVGCGTGAAARFAAQEVGPTGRVIGVDVNADMIRVARATRSVHGSRIEWHTTTAYELPLADQTADVVLCAQALQFFDDYPRALEEMLRVLKPGGRVAISVWCDLKKNPYFDAIIETLSGHLGGHTASLFCAAFRLTNEREIVTLLSAAGLCAVRVTTARLDLWLPGPHDYVPRHIRSSPVATAFDAAPPQTQSVIVADMIERMAQYQLEQGIQVPFCSHLAFGQAPDAGIRSSVECKRTNSYKEKIK